MKKNYMINLFTIIISVVVSSLASVGAISTMYDGTEVSYDNSSTHIAATDVQGAIDQIYATATDYTNLNSRLQILENNFPPFTTSTTHTVEYPYSGNGINLGKFSPTNDIWFDLYKNNKIQGAIVPLDTGGLSIRGWKDGVSLQGEVQLRGKKITANEVPIMTYKQKIVLNNWRTLFPFRTDSNYIYFYLNGVYLDPTLNYTLTGMHHTYNNSGNTRDTDLSNCQVNHRDYGEEITCTNPNINGYGVAVITGTITGS